MRFLSAMLLFSVALTGCAVPHPKKDFPVEKLAVDEFSLERAIDRYEALRDASFTILHEQPLATIERGPLLDIDAGRLEVAKALGAEQRVNVGRITLERHYAPLVRKYPMWFLAIVRDSGTKQVKIQVYERENAATEWVLMSSPEIVATTQLPQLRLNRVGAMIPLGTDEKSGLDASPKKVVKNYVKALSDPESKAAKTVQMDDFRSQMRDNVKAANSIKKVKYRAKWATKDVRYAVRTDDGGALVFATLQRLDTYQIAAGTAVAWPDGSAEKAFLADAVSGKNSLRYYYQVLLYIPPKGTKKPFVMGQYGGVVQALN